MSLPAYQDRYQSGTTPNFGGGTSGGLPNYDWIGAAQQQATGNLTGAQTATDANRVNQYNPFGSSTWSQDPSGQWSQSVGFSPQMQTLYDNYYGLGENFANAGGQALQQWRGTDPYGGTTPNAAGLHGVADTLYGAAASRLDPQWQQRQSQQDTQLYNQGLRPGGEAYTNAKRDMNYAQTDAYRQAQADALRGAQGAQQSLFGMGQQASNQAFNQAQQARGQTNPQSPQFQNFYQQQATTGPNYLGALSEQYGGALDIYNADTAKQNALMSGLFGMGSGILGLPTSGGGTFGGNLLTQGTNWLTGLLGNNSLVPEMVPGQFSLDNPAYG